MRICEVDGAIALPASEVLVIGGEVGGLGAGTYAIVPAGLLRGHGLVATAPLDAAPLVRTLDDLTWRPSYDGVHVATLHRGATSHTRLSRLDPGTRLRGISMPEGEDLVVLGGDLHDADHDLEPFDHVEYPPGSAHDPRTEGGCLLLVRSPVPGRRAQLATLVLLHVVSSGAWFRDKFDGFGEGTAWWPLADAVCKATADAWLVSPVDGVDAALWEEALGEEMVPRVRHALETEGQVGVTAFYLRCVIGAFDDLADVAPARVAGPAFACVREMAAAASAAVPEAPVARAFAAEYVAWLRGRTSR